MNEESNNIYSMSEWAALAGVSVRLLLVDPEAQISLESRQALQSLIDHAPDNLFDSLPDESKATLDLVSFIEMLSKIS